MVIGLLCPSRPLPPESIQHHATFICMFNYAMDQIESEIDGSRMHGVPFEHISAELLDARVKELSGDGAMHERVDRKRVCY